MKFPPKYQKPAQFYRSIPKIDLHRHLEGSLRFETIRELARTHGLDLPPTSQLRSMVQITENEPLTFENFLSKFSTLRLFYRSPEIIGRITREAIADAAADNVRYLELRFTPVALSRAQGFPLVNVIDWVIEATKQAAKDYGIKTRLIASVNRHEPVAVAAQVSYLAAERVGDGIVGLDLAGDEAGYSAEPFAEIFQAAKNKGLRITVHAGEWNKGENITQAINILHADRIGHGIRVLESKSATQAARENNVTFEVCLTSNYQSGAVAANSIHPFSKMLEYGLNTTLNTDDPSISRITLSNEYQLACEVLNLPLSKLKERVLAAAEAAFLPEKERRILVEEIKHNYPQSPNHLPLDQ